MNSRELIDNWERTRSTILTLQEKLRNETRYKFPGKDSCPEVLDHKCICPEKCRRRRCCLIAAGKLHEIGGPDAS